MLRKIFGAVRHEITGEWRKLPNVELHALYSSPKIFRISSSSVFCPRAGPSLQTQAPRLQFCPKAGLPLQTQEPRWQFY